MFGIPETTLCRLQKIQNKAARIITRTKTTDHIHPILKDLHWLPIKQRIEFKILCMAFKSLHQCSPSYLSELIQIYAPSRTLRSATSYILNVPRSRTLLGDRAFSICAPKLWNNLKEAVKFSPNIHQFKRRLKASFFSKVYQDT